MRLSDGLLLWTLKPLLAPEVAAVLKHIPRVWVQRPVASLARAVWSARDLDEAIIEREAVSDGVLPALLVLSVEREQVHDELVDLAQSAHFVLRLLDRHGDE